MSDITQQPLISPAKQAPAINPFARALADAEREKQYSGNAGQPQDSNSLFSDALARTGGSFADYGAQDDFSGGSNLYDQEEMMRQQEAQRKKEIMRRKLHDQVNPVDNIAVFDAREKQVKEEIDKVRAELKMLVREVADFQKEVDVTLMTEVANPGLEGKYYLTFFQQLRSFIMLLRQKISSAKTWATQMHTKNSKKKAGKFGAGMVVGGMTHEKTSTIQDMMHHERSSQYSGG